MASRKPQYTRGGNMLSAVRNATGYTQAFLADSMQGDHPKNDRAYVSKVENGWRLPEASWLEEALNVLKATYPQYQAVMDAFGYPPRMKLPTDDEIRWAKQQVADILASRLYPVYLGDCARRILDWNRHFSLLSPEDARRGWFQGMSMVEAWLGNNHPAFSFASLVENPEEIVPQQVRILYHEWQGARGEPWCQALLDKLLQSPSFRSAWKEAEQSTPADARRAQYALRLRIPVRMRVETKEGIKHLAFHNFGEPFVEDRRFILIGFQPADAVTSRQCLAWAEETT